MRSNNWCRPGPRVLLYGGPRTYARLPTDKIMLSLTTLADELEREKARLRVTDAMDRKAKGWTRHRRACLRDDNVEIIGANGEARRMVRALLIGRLAFTPNGEKGWRFSGTGTLRRALAGERSEDFLRRWRPRRDS